MDASKAKQLVQRLYTEVYSGGNVNQLDQYFSNNLRVHDQAAPDLKAGLAGYRELQNAYTRAFPKRAVTIDELLVAGDKVIVRWTCRGSHEGEYQGTPATHRKFNVTGISIYTFANDRISEIWQSWDTLSLLEQLNIIQLAHAHH
jgi:steroid delta-isomerase-like uncharacterized protein